MNRRILTLVLVGLISLSVFNSCKKGENDPFLSLKSRKGRLTGEWKLTSGELTETDGTDTETYTFTDTKVTYKEGSYTEDISYTQNLTINKDYTYIMKWTIDGDDSSEEGSWAFLGKNKELELKNKEAVVFYPSKATEDSDTETWDGVNIEYTYVIDQLKNKELVIKIDKTTSSEGDVLTSKGTYTFEKQ